MEKSQRGAPEMKEYGELPEQEIAVRARGRGLLAFISSTSGGACKEFVNRDFNAAINIRRCAVPETRPEELTRSNFVTQPLRLQVYREKLKPIAEGRSKKTGRCLRDSRYTQIPPMAAKRSSFC
jgi:hypothetical protein